MMDVQDPSESLPGAFGEWCTVAEAARRIGVSEKAVRERIKHGSIGWRPRGNAGREVLITPAMERDEPSREPLGILPEVVSCGSRWPDLRSGWLRVMSSLRSYATPSIGKPACYWPSAIERPLVPIGSK